MRRLLTAVIIVGLAALPAFGHGGQYQGPSDASGPGGSSGASIAPPTNPGGSAAPGPGAAASGGAATATARTATGRVARGQSGRKGATSGGGSQTTTKSYEIWEFWWENNKARYLNLKERLIKQTSVSGSPGHLTGRGRRNQGGSDSRRPTRSIINNEIIPSLVELLDKSDNKDILDSAVLALGRTADEAMADDVIRAAMPLLQHNELSVQSSSALALGVLGSPKASQSLQDVLRDDSAGRRLTGGPTNWLVRAFAALSLGLIGDETAVPSLLDVVDRLPDSDKDIKICAVVGLGLLGPEHPAAGDVRAFLVDKLSDRKLDPLIKSYIPTTLGKLGDPASIEPLLEVFNDRDTDNLVLQSTSIALGMLASMEHEGVIEALSAYIEEGRDEQTRHFSIISLGQIGARDEDFAAHQEAHDSLFDLLGKEIQKKGKSQNHRSWGALSAAIYARGQEERQPEFISRIKAAYDKESDPSYKAAYAVALGLLNDQNSASDIFDDFNSRKETDFRGYAAVALGFMQHTDAADALRGLCQNKTTTPTLRLQVAIGLGLMSDTQAVPVLIDTLDQADTLGVSSAVAKALGLIGDRDSISPLRKIAMDDSVQKITRAFACVALGIVGEKTDLPWNAAISANNNYRAQVPSIQEVLDIL